MKNILGKLLVFVTTAVCLLIVSSNVAAKRTTAVQSSSSNTVLYDGTAGGTPGTQNWLAYVVVGAATQAEVGGVTTLNTTLAGNGTYAGYPNNAAPNFGSYPAMNRQDGYELKFTVQLVTESHANNDRAGFSVIMLGDDVEGIELGFWTNEIWAQHDDSSGSMFTHAEGVTFDTTAALTNYRLAFLNDSYTLYADDIPILTGLLRNYTNHIGPIDPYETPRFIFFGDNTTSAQVTIQFSYAELTVATPNGDGTGPGGVGSTDGTSALHLWLRADGDVFTDGGCSTAVSANDDPVACWGDHSGYGNNAAQGATAPLYQTGVINGQPTIQLNGTSDYFSLPDFVSGFTAGEFFVALQAAADPPAATAQSGAWDFGTAAATSHYPFTDGDLYDGWGSTIRRSVTPGTSLAQFNLYNSGSQSGRWTNRLNGSILLDDTAANTVGFTSAPTLGRSDASTFLDGDIAEAILFNAVLNSAQRTILENYASAKYDLTLASTDVYAGDTAANGDYDLNVAGIGAESDGNQTEAHASGLVLAESASSLAAGEYLLAGHRTANNGNNNVDVPGGVTQRWQRVWYVDKTGGVDATLTFDFSEAGMDGLAGDPANYVLLYSAAQAPFSWSVLMSGATAVTIDQTAFTVTNANLNAGYYTLGTGDVVNSPTAVTLTQISSSPDNSSLMSLTLIIMLVVGGLVVFKKRLGHNPLSKQ